MVKDAYVKVMLTVIAAALSVLASRAVWDATPSAQAAEPPKAGIVCEWSYVRDNGEPDIGANGQVQMDEAWTAMSRGGWQLRSGANPVYVFERCR